MGYGFGHYAGVGTHPAVFIEARGNRGKMASIANNNMNSENPKTLLLVEDEVIIANLEKQQLENIGYSVHHAPDGKAAVTSALDGSIHFDLILMDIDLGGGIDGTAAALEILKHKEIPIVFLSSHTEPEIVAKTEKITSYGYVVKSSSITVLDASIKMALKLHEAKTEQKKAEDRYQTLFRQMLDGFALHEIVYNIAGEAVDYRYLAVNPAFERGIGLTARELIGRTVLDVFPGSELRWLLTYERVVRTGEPALLETYSPELNKFFKVAAFRYAPNQFACIFTDITARKQTEAVEKDKTSLLSTIMETSPVGIVTVDKTGTITYANIRAEQILGLIKDEITARTYDAPLWNHTDIDGSPLPDEKQPFTIVKKTLKTALNIRHGITWPDGTVVMLSINAAPIKDDDGAFNGMVATIEDVSEIQKYEDTIVKQLKEKETLLKEVHHRIKNNIASILGLLSMQAGATDNAEARSALQDAISRVHSIHVLYEKLLIGKDYQDVSVKSYIESLIASLVSVFPESKTITIEKKIADFHMNSKKLVSVGIIINELLTNIFKYAFTGKDNNRIFIEFTQTDTNAMLTIRDNGIGINEQITRNKTPGFGLMIVKMLAEQLEGTYTIENDNGTRSVLKFKL